MNATQQQTATEGHVRWMIRRDMEEVLAMDSGDGDHWDEAAFLAVLRERNCIGMVAEVGEQVVGFIIYTLHKSKLHLLRLAVHPEYRRLERGTVLLSSCGSGSEWLDVAGGIGSALLLKLVNKLASRRRNRITLDVAEDNLAAQLFLRANGFRAVRVDHGADGDSYRFVYRVTGDEADAGGE